MNEDSAPESPTELTPYGKLKQIQRALCDTWIKNLTADTALPLMGHVLLGQAIEARPDLNDPKMYLNLKVDEDYDASTFTLHEKRIYMTELSRIMLLDVIEDVMANIQDTLQNAMSSTRIVVGRSLRLLLTYDTSGPVHSVRYTLAWLTAPKETE